MQKILSGTLLVLNSFDPDQTANMFAKGYQRTTLYHKKSMAINCYIFACWEIFHVFVVVCWLFIKLFWYLSVLIPNSLSNSLLKPHFGQNWQSTFFFFGGGGAYYGGYFLLLLSSDFFKSINIFFFLKFFQEHYQMWNSLESDQDQHSVCPDLVWFYSLHPINNVSVI